MNKTISQDKYVDTHNLWKAFQNSFSTSFEHQNIFLPILEDSYFTHVNTLWRPEVMSRWTNYQRMDPWHLINLLAQRQPLAGISNWPLKLLFLTLGQFSFVLTMQNIIFPILADWYFAYETIIKTTSRYGWIVSSPRNMPMLPDEFYHQNNPSLWAFQDAFSISWI